MHCLFQWRQQSDLADTLNKFSFVEQSEIVRFLKETFEALFAIFVAPNCQPNSKLYYQTYGLYLA